MALDKLLIEWEPAEAPPDAEPTERESWAALRVVVQNVDGTSTVLTRLIDRFTHDEREKAYGPLIPLCEWIARSWPHLSAGVRVPMRGGGQDYDWARVRRWRHAGEGIALPDLWFHPCGEDSVRLTCAADRASTDGYEPVRFLESVQAVVSRQSLLDVLEGLVVSVLDRLQARVPSSDWRLAGLADYWSVSRRAPKEDGLAHRLAAMAGRFWWDTPEEDREMFRQLSRTDLDPVSMELLLASDPMTSLDPILAEAQVVWHRCEQAHSAPDSWLQLRQALEQHAPTLRGFLPWQKGWRAAGLARKALGWADDSLLGDLSGLPQHTDVHALKSVSVGESVVAWSANKMPVRTRALPYHNRRSSERFLRVRDSYPMLFEGSPSSSHARLLRRNHKGANPEANAFAAELLVPICWLRAHLAGTDHVDAEVLLDIAKTAGAPAGCVSHQIENHHLATVGWGEMQ